MNVTFRKRDSFHIHELKGMLAIYQQSYKCTWEEFLEKKDSIDLYATYVDAGQIVGFTGMCYKKITVDGKNYMAMYVGQTVIPAAYRGKSLIQKTIIKLLFRHYVSHPFTRLVIWNNAVTYRPYLIMAKGLKDYYPHLDKTHSGHYKNIQDTLGDIYYRKYYIPETGLVKKDVNVMEAHEVNYTAKELADPHIRYYLERNPGSAQGHGLISFCFGSWENLWFFIHKRRKRRFASQKQKNVPEMGMVLEKQAAEHG